MRGERVVMETITAGGRTVAVARSAVSASIVAEDLL